MTDSETAQGNEHGAGIIQRVCCLAPPESQYTSHAIDVMYNAWLILATGTCREERRKSPRRGLEELGEEADHGR
jgi:hypothetical protein